VIGSFLRDEKGDMVGNTGRDVCKEDWCSSWLDNELKCLFYILDQISP
jgi:hypothetical protein